VNISWKVVVVAIIATLVAGCSPTVSQPPGAQPTTAPVATPSPSQEAPPTEPTPEPEPEPSPSAPKGMADLWEIWKPKEGKTIADVKRISADYGLEWSWITTPNVTQMGYKTIGLIKGEKCVALFTSFIGSDEPEKWPMDIMALPRFQPPNTEPVDIEKVTGVKNPQQARSAVETMAKNLNC